MATKTLGTNATSSLTALKFLPGYGSGMAAADIASINIAIKDPAIANFFTQGGQFSAGGQLFIPGSRGVIQLQAGDWVGVDSTGWPIVVSKNAIANGPWTHS